MTLIKDGTGNGYMAEVDSDNKLETHAVTQDAITYHSEVKKKAFSVYGKRNFVAADTNENILSMTYTGDGQLHIQKIMFSTNSDSGKVEVYFDATSISGGASVIPLVLNRGSSLASESTCLNGGSDLTGTVAAAKEMFDVRLSKASFLMDFGGSIILTKNDNLFILGEVATIADKIRVMVYYYED